MRGDQFVTLQYLAMLAYEVEHGLLFTVMRNQRDCFLFLHRLLRIPLDGINDADFGLWDPARMKCVASDLYQFARSDVKRPDFRARQAVRLALFVRQ